MSMSSDFLLGGASTGLAVEHGHVLEFYSCFYRLVGVGRRIRIRILHVRVSDSALCIALACYQLGCSQR